MSLLMRFEAADGRGASADDIRTAIAQHGILCDATEQSDGTIWLVSDGRELVWLHPMESVVPTAFVEHVAGGEQTDTLCETLTDLGYVFIED
jgi:hypothetical protein